MCCCKRARPGSWSRLGSESRLAHPNNWYYLRLLQRCKASQLTLRIIATCLFSSRKCNWSSEPVQTSCHPWTPTRLSSICILEICMLCLRDWSTIRYSLLSLLCYLCLHIIHRQTNDLALSLATRMLAGTSNLQLLGEETAHSWRWAPASPSHSLSLYPSPKADIAKCN